MMTDHQPLMRMNTAVNLARESAPRGFREPVFAFVTAFVFISSCSLGFTQTALPGSAVANVRIGVLGLFHPHQLTVSASQGQALVVHAGDERIVLERSSGVDTASVQLSGSEIILQPGTRTVHTSALTVAGRESDPANFVLAVPGTVARHYRGTLEIRASAGYLLAVVTMDRETAVASIVAAENTPETPFEALKAQAVATRSYLAAGRGRHREFDFCDTTHCQFLREPPAPGTPVAQAVAATRFLVLAYESEPFAAMYTRSCSGRTRTPAELGLPAATYPYYSVECKYCRAHPVRWSSRISAEDAATLRSSNEPARLRAARHLGWSMIPSSDFIMKKEGGQILVEGTGQGHGIGLCQSGARAMATDGADFRQILSHYYPNTTIVRIHTAADSLSQQSLTFVP
ncbi:MAG: SpoIID/LytB domain-containing protein [Candidatus Sulfotelmatobacter sp.]